MQQVGHFQQPLLVEAADDVLEPSRLAPGDAVPLLRRAGVVVVNALKIVVLVVPACNALTRPRRHVCSLTRRVDSLTAVAPTWAHEGAIDATAPRSRSFLRRVADHGKVANNIPMYSHGCVTPGKGASCLLNREPGHLAVLFKFQPDCVT